MSIKVDGVLKGDRTARRYLPKGGKFINAKAGLGPASKTSVSASSPCSTSS